MFKVSLLLLGATASSLALPAGPLLHPLPHHAPVVAPHPIHPAPYHAAPHHDPYKIPPRPYSYAYGVADEYAGTNFDKKETQDEHGVVSGEYRVALPDGRTQIVTYHADHENGYIADVKYEGVPVHPPAAKPYHAAPVKAHPVHPVHPVVAPHALPLHPVPVHPALPL